MYCHIALLLGLLGVSDAATYAATWHPLKQVEQPIKTFDSQVLGQLGDIGTMRDLRVSRSHLFVADTVVGTPGQELTCLLDTGSADLWIPSKRCQSCDNEHHFHADKSETFMPAMMKTNEGLLPVQVKGHDDGGFLVGFLVQDLVQIGSTSFHNQSFLIVEKEHLAADRAWDGICGLGWQSMTAAGRPLYRTLQKQGAWAIFSLVPTVDLRETALVIGDLPHGAYDQRSLAWAEAVHLNSENDLSFWMVKGSVKSDTGKEDVHFLIDTGTPFLLAPRSDYVRFMHSLFPEHLFQSMCGVDKAVGHLVVCHCGIMESYQLPDQAFAMYIGSQSYAISIPRLFKKVPSTDGGELCLLQIQPNLRTALDPLALLEGLLGIGGAKMSPAANHGNGSSSGTVPLGILPPFLFPQPGGMFPLGGEQIEEISKTKPDGSICMTTLVWGNGTLQQNTTQCKAPENADTSRRLQLIFPKLEGVRDVMSNTWVLGGVFLENFVVMLDFEHRRVGMAKSKTTHSAPNLGNGIAEPSPSPSTHVIHFRPRPIMSSSVEGANSQSGQQQHGSFSWAVVLFGICILSALAGAGFLSNKMRRRKFLNTPPEIGTEELECANIVDDDQDAVAAE